MAKNSSFILWIYMASAAYVSLNAFSLVIPLIDEALCLLLFSYAIFKGNIVRQKEFRIFSIIALFYLVYSLHVGINVPIAVVRDFFQFMKPFFCFYTIYYSRISFTDKQKKIMMKLSLVLAVYCFCLLPFINQVYGNTSSYYHACTFAGLLYLMSSEMKKKDLILFIVILMPGLASIRSKFFSEMIAYTYILFGVNKVLKPSVRMVIVMSAVAVLAIWANYEKFNDYFNGYDDGRARTILYYTSFQMLKDYFPFGSGFGTFATDASAMYYSPIYYKYGLNLVFGMSLDDYKSSSSFFMDTFYPVVLGQFGLLGMVLFVKFWITRLRNAANCDLSKYKLFMIVFLYFAIESIASESFLGPTSVMPMMTLGFCLNSQHINHEFPLKIAV